MINKSKIWTNYILRCEPIRHSVCIGYKMHDYWITLLQTYWSTSWFTSHKVGYSIGRAIKFDAHNDNNDISYYCLLPVLVSDCLLAHIRLLYVVCISYTSMAYHWRIHHLIFYTAFLNQHVTCNTSKIISKCRHTQKTKPVSVVILVVGTSSWNALLIQNI